MSRTINTIPRNEYYELLGEAASRMRKKIYNLIEDEDSKSRNYKFNGDFEKAEEHDFNLIALHIALCAITKSPNEFRKEAIK